MSFKFKEEFKELFFSSLGRDSLGCSIEDFFGDSVESASVSVRINEEKFRHLLSFSDEDFSAKSFEEVLETLLELPPISPIKWCKGGYYLKEKINFTLSPLFRNGAYYVQDSSSMFLQLLEEQIKSRCADSSAASFNVLDLCAAPGGKSTHLLSAINEICNKTGDIKRLFVCNEPITKRVGALLENVEKWGYENVLVTSNYPKEFQRLAANHFPLFDIILTDVPCSGEGMFRKSVEAQQGWSVENVRRCAQVQKEILQDIWPLLKNGGLFIYSTCTYNHFENGDNIEFMEFEIGAENLNELIKESAVAAGAIPVFSKDNPQHILGFQFVAGVVNGEGQFFSLLKKGGEPSNQSSKPSRRLNEKQIIKNSLRVLNDEIVAVIKGKDVVPSHSFALSNKMLSIIEKNRGRSEVELYIDSVTGELIEESGRNSRKCLSLRFMIAEIKKETALKYLRKEPLSPLEILPSFSSNFNPDSLHRGYILLTYKHLPLGFIKNLGNRINNLLPNNRRILNQN